MPRAGSATRYRLSPINTTATNMTIPRTRLVNSVTTARSSTPTVDAITANNKKKAPTTLMMPRTTCPPRHGTKSGPVAAGGEPVVPVPARRLKALPHCPQEESTFQDHRPQLGHCKRLCSRRRGKPLACGRKFCWGPGDVPRVYQHSRMPCISRNMAAIRSGNRPGMARLFPPVALAGATIVRPGIVRPGEEPAVLRNSLTICAGQWYNSVQVRRLYPGGCIQQVPAGSRQSGGGYARRIPAEL
jgi:hypothetical protein